MTTHNSPASVWCIMGRQTQNVDHTSSCTCVPITVCINDSNNVMYICDYTCGATDISIALNYIVHMKNIYYIWRRHDTFLKALNKMFMKYVFGWVNNLHIALRTVFYESFNCLHDFFYTTSKCSCLYDKSM